MLVCCVELESRAHVIDLCRSQQGQFLLSDALKQEDWSLDNVNKLMVVTKSKRLKDRKSV